ncbi:MAG: hypothetical protein ACE5I1_04205 [bacterium]
MSTKNFMFVLVFAHTLCVWANLFAQERPVYNRLKEPGKSLCGSFEHRALTEDHFSINYYGAMLEFDFNDRISVSGPVYFGTASNDVQYLHIPFGGMFGMLIAVIGYTFAHPVDLWLGDLEYDWVEDNLKLLVAENVYYNIPVNDGLVVSPYVNFLGIDFDLTSEDSIPGEGAGGFATFGLGVRLKLFPTKHLILSPDLGLKYFMHASNSTFKLRSGDQFGYSVGMNLGFAF